MSTLTAERSSALHRGTRRPAPACAPSRPAGAVGSTTLDLAPRRCLPRPTRPTAAELLARRRRRAVVLAGTALALLVALALPWGGTGGHTLAAPGPVLAGATVGSLYIVQPGDTMWSIAQRLDPSGDPRVIVAELEAQVGSDVLQAGEHIRLP